MFTDYESKHLEICTHCLRVMNDRKETSAVRYDNDCDCLPDIVVNLNPLLEKWEWSR